MFSLKRFNSVSRKLNDKVAFPIDKLDLTCLVRCKSNEPLDCQQGDPLKFKDYTCQYRLFGVCNHYGQIGNGHCIFNLYTRHCFCT